MVSCSDELILYYPFQ